jgi:hypothetical protein
MRRSLALAGLIAATAAGCNSGDDKMTGVAQLSVTSVPTNVWCISLEADRDASHVRHTFDVSPGQPALLNFTGSPTGWVTFTAKAFPASCGFVDASNPTWQSDPAATWVEPGVVAYVHLTLRRAGNVNVDIDFDDDGGAPDDMGDGGGYPPDLGGGDGGGFPPDMTQGSCSPEPEPNRRTLVANMVTVPTDRNMFALDLNGDGRVDNQLGNIIGALTQQGIDSQLTIRDAVIAGSDIILFDQGSNDPFFNFDSCASLTLLTGLATALPPAYNGTDVFTIDNSVAPTFLAGPIGAGRFDSVNVTPTLQPLTATVKLPFAGTLIPVPLVGVRVSLRPSTTPGIAMTGQINGAIRNSDVQGVVVPAIARALTAQVTANPNLPSSQSILSLFDSGGTRDLSCPATDPGCRNPDGTCARARDNIISTCEVGTSGLIQNVLAPDVQLFSDDGSVYQPNRDNTHKDSLSVGLGVTLVNASF